MKQKNQIQIKEKSPIELTPFEMLNKKINDHNDWLYKCYQLIEANVNPTDDLENERIIMELKDNQKDLPYRVAVFNNDYQKYMNKISISNEIETMTKVSIELSARLSKAKSDIREKLMTLEKSQQVFKQFQDDLNDMLNWVNSLHLDLVRYQENGHIRRSSFTDEQQSPSSESQITSAQYRTDFSSGNNTNNNIVETTVS